eukprot:4815395-Ditylum_brightwellii.AAC.1
MDFAPRCNKEEERLKTCQFILMLEGDSDEFILKILNHMWTMVDDMPTLYLYSNMSSGKKHSLIVEISFLILVN